MQQPEENCGSDHVALDPDTMEAECMACKFTWSADPAANEGIMKKVREPCTCQHCGASNVYPKPELVCPTCGDNNKPRSIFECQLTLKKSGQKKDTRLYVSSWKFQEPDPRLFDPQFQGHDPEWNTKIADANRNPIDLDELLGAETPEVQAQLLNINGVRSPWAAVSGTQDFARPRHRRD